MTSSRNYSIISCLCGLLVFTAHLYSQTSRGRAEANATAKFASSPAAVANVEVYATGLTSPIGIAVDGRGWLWVAEQGTGNQDSRVVVVTTDGQVHPFLAGLPSEFLPGGEVSGATHPYFNGAGELLLLQGGGTDSLSQAILVVDTTGFTPGQPPFGRDAIKAVHKLGDFVLSQPGIVDSNPFTMAFGPNDDQYIVDAGANAIIRRDNATGNLSVFASFPPLQNPTPVGPPFIDAVPTGIVFAGDRFYVSSLTGFPFLEGMARVYEVDLDGNISVIKDGLTTVTDLAIDPRDGYLVVSQFGRFSLQSTPPRFVPGTGSVLKLRNGPRDRLAVGLNLISSMQFGGNGELFVASLFGQILKVTFPIYPENAGAYATGLTGPIGMAVDGRGWLWVAEQGSGNQDSRVVVVTTDGQVHPFLAGLPSEFLPGGEVSGATHPYFNSAGELLLLQGGGTDSLSQAILVVDTTGFIPGQPPLGRDAIKAAHKLGDFVLSQPGIVDSNPFTMAFGPNDDQYVVDAGANAIIRRDQASGDLSVFASFPPLPNPTPVGPPFIDAVPTGIVFTGDKFYVSSLTGFPFVDGMARIYEVDLAGNVTVFKDGLTTMTDIAIDPRDGNLIVAQFGRFSLQSTPPGFVPGTGSVLKLREGAVDTLAQGLSLISSMQVNAAGEVFVASLFGDILKIESVITGIASPQATGGPETFVLWQNYPNPFNPETKIRYELSTPERIVLKIYNLLGQEVRTLVNQNQPAGVHEIVWDGRSNEGLSAPSGVYLYRLTNARGGTQMRKMALVR